MASPNGSARCSRWRAASTTWIASRKWPTRSRTWMRIRARPVCVPTLNIRISMTSRCTRWMRARRSRRAGKCKDWRANWAWRWNSWSAFDRRCRSAPARDMDFGHCNNGAVHGQGLHGRQSGRAACAISRGSLRQSLVFLDRIAQQLIADQLLRAIAQQPVVDRLGGDAQRARGLTLVVVEMRERLQQHLALDVVEGHADGETNRPVAAAGRPQRLLGLRLHVNFAVLAGHDVVPLHRMPQFAHVAGPGAITQAAQRIRVEDLGGAVTLVQAIEEMPCQQRNVFRSE